MIGTACPECHRDYPIFEEGQTPGPSVCGPNRCPSCGWPRAQWFPVDQDYGPDVNGVHLHGNRLVERLPFWTRVRLRLGLSGRISLPTDAIVEVRTRRPGEDDLMVFKGEDGRTLRDVLVEHLVVDYHPPREEEP